jgi:hypothetical protein
MQPPRHRFLASISLRVLVGVYLTFVATGCATQLSREGTSQSVVTNARTDTLHQILAGDRLLHLKNGHFLSPARIVIRDSADWRMAWGPARQSGSTVPDLPQIDFRKHMILMAAQNGMVPGDSLNIESFQIVNDTLWVTVRKLRLCQPFTLVIDAVDVVKLPRSSHPVVFRDRTDGSMC